MELIDNACESASWGGVTVGRDFTANYPQGPGADPGKGATSQKTATRRCAMGVYRAKYGSTMDGLAVHLGDSG